MRALWWALGAAVVLSITASGSNSDDGLLLYDGARFNFALVSDLDLKSRDPQDFLWRSYLQQGTLVSVPARKDECRDQSRLGNKAYQIEWARTLTLETETAKKNRSMELSELVTYEGRLLAMCDYTGLIFKLDTAYPPEGVQPKVFQRWAIADGNGEKVKPCKLEWATVKDGLLWVGSVGKEWVNAQGETVHRDAEWVKTIDKMGRVRNIDWGNIYAALRFAGNATEYLWHEAIHFCPRNRKWYVLPRKRSITAKYDPVTDEQMGTNILLIASEDFRDIQVQTIGPLQPDRGFTALRKIPGTNDHFLALKVREVGDETATWITAFDTNGNMLLDKSQPGVDADGFLLIQQPGNVKFEGLEFI